MYCTPGMQLKLYSEVTKAAFGWGGRMVVRMLKDFNLLGVVGIYIALAEINNHSLVAGMLMDHLGVQFWIAFSALLVWAVIFMACKVNDVFVFSLFGTLTTVATVVIIV
ncbi:hypothetical protein GGF37_004350 [Kickxella alabastrina]|nr:hypothetical protein GGF37_004350 [Kickxella alabastrina]